MNVRLSHLRITASAGTGKTFRLTDRIVELVLLEKIGWKELELTPEERESARHCAREAAQEYREDAVLDWIRNGKWERLAVKVDYDDFEELGLGRFIEEKAIEVEE